LEFQFIPKVIDGVEVRALCRPVKFFHIDFNKTFLYRPHFVHRGIVMLKQERAIPKLLPQRWKHRMSLYSVALRFPFTGTDGLFFMVQARPQTIIPPPPNFTVGTLQSGR
jgi:hypothetical protein